MKKETITSSDFIKLCSMACLTHMPILDSYLKSAKVEPLTSMQKAIVHRALMDIMILGAMSGTEYKVEGLTRITAKDVTNVILESPHGHLVGKHAQN